MKVLHGGETIVVAPTATALSAEAERWDFEGASVRSRPLDVGGSQDN
jgi:hypothetical protein